MSEFNTTQLNPETAFERHVFHRDQFAHYLRWSFVLNRLSPGSKILDFGCGSGNLYEVLYRNRYSPERFLGIDIRKQTIDKNKEKFPKAEWLAHNLVDEKFTENCLSIYGYIGNDWDAICSFEVIEHVNKNNGQIFVNNLASLCSTKTIVYLSTPNYDPEVGAADNHIYDGKIQEYTHRELEKLLDTRFEVIEKFGTFASKRDYYKLLDEPMRQLWDRMHTYWDSNLMANIFAPLFPEESRNCLWVLKLR